MRTLWEIVNKHFDSESAAAAFLTINIICWTAGTLAAGLLFCLITGTPAALCITKLMCAAIYAGIIVGLLGGILFLYKGFQVFECTDASGGLDLYRRADVLFKQ